MIIKAYVRMQDCIINSNKAFIPRGMKHHGVTKGPIRYYAIEGSSWTHIRHLLKTHLDCYIGYSGCNKNTCQAWAKDIGTAQGRAYLLKDSEIPEAAREDVSRAWATPELTGFQSSATVRSK